MTVTVSPFQIRNKIHVRALFIGERIDVRALEATEYLAETPLMVRAGDRGAAVLFRYGVAVLFDLTPLEEVSFLSQLKPLVTEPFPEPETEDLDVVVEPQKQERIDPSGALCMQAADTPHLQILASVLAKSVVLAHYETKVAAVFDRVDPLAAGLERSGKVGTAGKELLSHIGGALLVQHKMVGRVEVVEKPELLWEQPQLERLYARLQDEYEVPERHRALDRKLELISRTAETVLDLLQQRRSLRVEWYIVILIVVEIILYLYEIFFVTH